MTAAKFRADYAQLDKIATQFRAQGAVAQQTLRDLQAQMRVLQIGDWIGRGANRFYEEMQSNVLPSQRRLVEALREAASATDRINHIAQQAERDAAVILDKAPGETGNLPAIGQSNLPLPPEEEAENERVDLVKKGYNVLDFMREGTRIMSKYLPTLINKLPAPLSKLIKELVVAGTFTALQLDNVRDIVAPMLDKAGPHIGKVGKVLGKVAPFIPWVMNYIKYADEGGTKNPRFWADSLLDTAQWGTAAAVGLLGGGPGILATGAFLAMDLSGENDKISADWVRGDPRFRETFRDFLIVSELANFRLPNQSTIERKVSDLIDLPKWFSQNVPDPAELVRQISYDPGLVRKLVMRGQGETLTK
jgi:WXG100 family type VII secretion target